MVVRKSRDERGATLVVVALMSLALTATVGMVAQVGMLYAERTRMQVAADAAALAGAKLIPNGPTAAIHEAVSYAAKNGCTIDPSAVSVTDNEFVTVNWQQPADTVMTGILHMQGAQVGVHSKADLHCINRVAGVRPWGVVDTAFFPGGEYVLKATSPSRPGNFGALAIDGPGANIYRTEIINGSQKQVNVGDGIATEPGNIVGPTVQAVNQLIGYDQTSYQDAIAHPDQTTRVVTIPLITQASWNAANGKSAVVVSGFARFYLTYTDSMGEVVGRFIDRVNASSVAGTYNQYVVKLVD